MFASKTLVSLALLAAATVIASTPTAPVVVDAAVSSTSTSSAAGTTQTIIAAKNGTTDLTFSPNTLTAAPGTFVEFQFMGMNHSVAQSAFATPCTPLNSLSFYSGFNFATKSGLASNVFTLQINSTAPVWFYCPQAQHCVKGMIGVINAPAGKTAADFAANAKTATVSVPAQVQGGIVEAASSAATSASSTGASSTSAAISAQTGSASHLTVGMGFMGLVGIGFSALLSI